MTEKLLDMTEKILKISRRIAAAVTITTLFTFLATDAVAQLRYGFRFGGDFAKASLGNAYVLGSATSHSGGYSGTAQAQQLREGKLVNRSGFSGGLVLEYQFEKCGFAPDIALLYTRYNTRLLLPLDFIDEKPRSFGRNFIEVPIHLKWKFWIPQTKNLFAPMVYTGPSLMFRVGHDKGLPYYTYQGVLPAGSYTSPTGDAGAYLPATRANEPSAHTETQYFRTKVFQPGWDVGIGFDVINFIQITAGYRFGLGDALDTPSAMSLRTNAWTLSATLLFDF